MNLPVDYFKSVLAPEQYEKLQQTIQSKEKALYSLKSISSYVECVNNIAKVCIPAKHKNYTSSAVQIGDSNELTQKQKQDLDQALREFTPWRKGPFSIFGTYIDSEWQSNLKWDRIEPLLDNLSGQVVCDLGCGNGYYMFRLLSKNPRYVFGIDPTYKFKLCFELLQCYAQEDRLSFALLGYQDLTLLPNCFDVVLCMGIIYHHPDPLHILEMCRFALKPGGLLIVETLGNTYEESLALYPSGRYARMKNVYFIPSVTCLQNWLVRAKFEYVKKINVTTMGSQEQRRTEWADVPSFADFLDPQNPELTEEGYKIPQRVIFSARKKNR